MCGRFTLRTPTPVLAKTFRFELSSNVSTKSRFNIAPTQGVLTVQAGQAGQTSKSSEGSKSNEPETRTATNMHWGLVPSWAKDPTGAARLINCRSETAAEKPSFRSAFRRRRCLILADGYYEWERIGKQRLPWYIHRTDETPFAMAGLWETWRPDPKSDTDAAPHFSCTILTTRSNQRTSSLHDRMPVILSSLDEDTWLNSDLSKREELEHLFEPFPSDDITLRPVTTHVNNARHEDEACLEPRSTQRKLF